MSIVLKKAPKIQGYYSIPDLPEFRLRCTLPMTAEVYYMQYSKLKKVFAGSYTPGINLEVCIDFKEILKTLLASEEPKFHLEYFTQYDFIKEIHVVFKDAEKELERVFYITDINATSQVDIDVVFSKRFLTFQPDVKETTVDSPEFLSYFYTGEKVRKLVAKFYLKAGGSEIVTLYSWNAKKIEMVTHNVSYRQILKLSNTSSSEKKPFYDIYIVDENNQRISVIQRYVFRESTGRENYYLFYNSLGGLDSLITTGDIFQKPDVSYDVVRTSSGLIPLDNTEDHITYNQKSGYFSIDNIPYVIDFVLSKKNKYLFNPEDKACHRIVMTENDSSFNKKESFTSFSFSYRKMNDIPAVDDSVIEVQELVVENMQAQSMPLEMPKRGVNVQETENLCTCDPIECTLNSVLMYIETEGLLSVYTSVDAETWTLIDQVLVHGNTMRSIEQLTIGSYLKIESETTINNIDTLFSNAQDNY